MCNVSLREIKLWLCDFLQRNESLGSVIFQLLLKFNFQFRSVSYTIKEKETRYNRKDNTSKRILEKKVEGCE